MKKLFLFLTLFLSIQIVSGQEIVNEYIKLIIEYTEKSGHEEAIKICDKLLIIKPNYFYAYYLRGLNHYLAEDYDDAITDFDRSVKLNPDFSDTYLKRAKAKSKINNYMGAMADYNRVRNERFYETVSSFAGDVIWSLFSGRKDNKTKQTK